MANYVQLCGFETGDASAARSTGGTFSIQGTTVRTGAYALRVNPTTTATGVFRIGKHAATGAGTDINVATTYVRFYFRIATAPASLSEEIFSLTSTSGGSMKCAVRLDSDRKLSFYNQANVLVSTGATVLATDTWYRIDVKAGNGTTAAWEVRIDGVSEISGTADLVAANSSNCRIGKQTNRNGQTIDVYYDDFAVADDDYPPAGAIEGMIPNADGNYTAWTASAGSDYQCVDDVPHNSDTDYISSSTAAQVTTAALESAASAGISGTVNAVKALVIVRAGSGSGGVQQRTRSGSTDLDTTTMTTSTTYEICAQVHNTDPATSAAWLLAALDSVEVGVDQTGIVETRCTLAMAEVDFTVAAGGQPTMRRWGGVPGLLGAGRIGRGW